MKIVQIGKYYPPNWGGIETVTYNIQRLLSKSKDVDCISLVHGSCEVNDEDVFSYRPFFIFGVPFSTRMWLDIFRDHSANTVYLLHLPNPSALIPFLFCSRKVVLYWHAPAYGNFLLQAVNNFITKLIVKKSNKIFVATKKHIDTINVPYNASKILEVDYPIDPDLFSVDNSAKELNTEDRLRLLAIGRLVKYKDYPVLIEAAAMMRKKMIDFTLKILGNGPELEMLNSLIIKNGLSDCVEIIANCSENDRAKYLSDSDLLCFTSNNNREMYGVVQIEAHSYGLPVVCSNLAMSGMTEIVERSKAGTLFETGSAEALVEAICKYIDDRQLLAQHSMNAAQFVQSKRGNEEFLKSIEGVLSEI